MSSFFHDCRYACLVFALACGAVPLNAAPRLPASDDEVLERLATRPGDSFARERTALQSVLSRDPRNLDMAMRLAQMHVARGRSESDPRELGRAQAVLAPWWGEREPPVPVLVLRATLRQTNHQFDLARADLQQAVRREPGNAQAWLTLATVQQVTGELSASRQSCERLATLVPAMIHAPCLAAIDGVSGRATEALASLAAVLDQGRAAPAGLRAWATSLQAELAERVSRDADAERLYRAALALDPRDAYSIAAYADFLLDQGRPAEALALVPADSGADPLLLRRALALRALHSPEAAGEADRLAARFAASHARGDRVHLREEARFALEVLLDPPAALALARDNWKVQKEPTDARILLEAAAAARDPAAAREVVAWVRSTRLEGRRIGTLVASLGGN